MNWYKKADHDYNPIWDYTPTVISNEEINQITQNIKKEISLSLLPLLDIPNIEIHFVKDINELGKYINGTSPHPVIVLNIKNINKARKQYDVELETAIETTITHELGHAMQEQFGLPQKEEQAEELAYQWHYNKQIPDWVSKLVNKKT